MAAPREYTDAFIIIKKLFLGGLRGLQSNSKQYETPCTMYMQCTYLEFDVFDKEELGIFVISKVSCFSS